MTPTGDGACVVGSTPLRSPAGREVDRGSPRRVYYPALLWIRATLRATSPRRMSRATGQHFLHSSSSAVRGTSFWSPSDRGDVACVTATSHSRREHGNWTPCIPPARMPPPRSDSTSKALLLLPTGRRSARTCHEARGARGVGSGVSLRGQRRRDSSGFAHQYRPTSAAEGEIVPRFSRTRRASG